MKSLRLLLVIHALITLAAAVVLIVAPRAIPHTVDIEINPSQYLLSYFLGAAELGIAYLSFQSRNIRDSNALRIIVFTFIIFHGSTGLLELYGFYDGLSPKILINVLLRLAIVFLFYYYGIYKKR